MVVEDVRINLDKQKTDSPQGTDTIVENLSFKLGKREVQRLARELLLLADPFDSKASFRPRLIAPGFTELEKQVQDAYFEDAELQLLATLDANGKAEAKLMDWKGDVLFHANHEDIARSESSYKTVSSVIEAWIFVFQSDTFSRRERMGSSTEIRNWLSIVGGIHLYHRGLRVKPYGDLGDDWLNINLARAKAHELRPSTNTVIGRVIADDPTDRLVQKTDRLGFIEDESFSELRRFAINTFDWMAKVRLNESEKKRAQAKKNIENDLENAKIEVEQTIAALEIPSSSRSKVFKVIQNYEKLKDRYIRTLGPPVEKLFRAANSLRSFAKFPLHLLKRAKRKSTVVNVHEVIAGVINLFEPFLEEYKVDIQKALMDDSPSVLGSVALLEAVLVNLMTNALNAFNSKDAPCQERKIMICTELTKPHLELRFMDNSTGIKGLELDEIWLPGRTTTLGGTGLGLTIVKDSVTDLGGQIWAIENGELGGAEFIINLPLVEYND